MQKSLDPMSVKKTETPSASYVLKRRYGPARHIIAFASWVTVISMLLQPVAALAGTVNWDGSDSAAWDTGANWDGNAKPGSSDNAAFPTTVPGTGSTITLGSGETAQSLTFNNTYTLSGGTLTIGGSGSISVASGKIVTITSTITGTSAITKADEGTVTIQNATLPSFSTVTLSGGTLKLSVDAMGTGGTVTQVGGNVIHTFLNNTGANQTSYTLNLPNSVSASVLVVGGGGGGGSFRGGGGGAGGLLYYGIETPANGHREGTSYTINAGNTSVLVGKGGSGSTVAVWETRNGTNGFDSQLGSLTAVGGGSGGYLTVGNITASTIGAAGGSGGGGGGKAPANTAGPGGNSTGTGTQGYAGGSSGLTGTYGYPGGGGGGAGGSGGDGVGGATNTAGTGGLGLQYSISGSGTSTWYAGGGGGGRYISGSAGGLLSNGGSGVGGSGATGGDGVNILAYDAAAGTANTGSGGGGGGNVGNGGAGSSGIVIVSYARFEGSVNLPSTHVDTTASSTLDLTAAAGNHTLGKFSVAGDQTLTIANANNVTLNGIGTGPTVSIAATGSGTATISGTGITLYPKGDITTSGASLSIGPAVVINSSGTRNVSGTVTMANLDLSSATGTISTGTDKLKISSTLKLQDGAARLVTGTYTAEGTATSFSAQGNDLANNGVGRTLTLSGGKLTLTGADNIGTGGTVTQAGGKVIHTFDNTGADDQKSYTLNLPDSVSASVLVVGGGGGGGSVRGGGGGAGGLIYYGSQTPNQGTSFSISAGNTSVLVGKGGVADANGFASTLGSLNAIGGGYGGTLSNPTQGNTGGSGGGSAGTSITGGSETSGQGSKGGDSNSGGGGGGGAGGGGANGTNPSLPQGDAGNGGNGGAGLQYSISGTANSYAAGGGGGSYYSWNTGGVGGTGESGIGGNGGGQSSAATTGAANTGSGGGGGYNSGAGAAGGSGIVIVSYALGPSAINLSSTHIAAEASSTLDLAAASKNHTLGNVTVTAGATLDVINVTSLKIGTLTIGINGANYGKLDLGTKGLTLGNGDVPKLAVTSVSPIQAQACCVAVAANGSFGGLNATEVTDNNNRKWTVAVKNSGTELWLTPPPASGTLILFK